MALAAALEQWNVLWVDLEVAHRGANAGNANLRTRTCPADRYHASAGLAPRRAVLAFWFAEQGGLSPAARVRVEVDRSAGYWVG